MNMIDSFVHFIVRSIHRLIYLLAGWGTVYSCINMVLQVQRRDGVWIDADPIPNAVLINIADMLQRWTSDKLISVVYIMNNNNMQKYFT